MNWGKLVAAALTLLVLSTVFVAPAAADHETEEERQTGFLGELIETLEDFTEGKSLTEILQSVLFQPFIELGEALWASVIRMLTATPSVDGNPAVEDVHSDVLLVTFLLSTLAFIVAGILHMVGPILGVSYREVRQILPRVVVALIFATVSLPLLQLSIEFTRALTTAFEPQLFETTFQQRLGLSTGLVLAYVIQAILLLAIAILFYIRNVYILFVAAISPLLALGWSLPRVKRYADTFIAGWFAALLIAPLDMLVLKFSFALFSGQGNTVFQGVSNWILGVSFPVMILLVSKQIWDASQAAVGLSYAASSGVKKRMNSSDDREGEFAKMLDEDQKQRLRENRRKRRASTGSKKFDFGGDDD
ncbi:hypothetical protein [Salinirussus salinus]|uniref:hypothetical protein n=1 Tax=Salinirussus salinus TaxID=1198300 RepID=UPI001356AA97|nr:hypothetical protein [Salinirussus salinus]